MSRSSEFFRLTVEPTVRDFMARRGDLRLGSLAAIVLNHMADYWSIDGHAVDQKQLRNQLRAQYPAFAVIADVADAAKRVRLDRRSRSLTKVEQVTATRAMFSAPFGSGVFHEAWFVAVTLDDDTTHLLHEAVSRVQAMWREKLNQE